MPIPNKCPKCGGIDFRGFGNDPVLLSNPDKPGTWNYECTCGHQWQEQISFNEICEWDKKNLPKARAGLIDAELAAIRERADKATPGPWEWNGNTASHSVYLYSRVGPRYIVMDFVRWGMSGAQPRFRCEGLMEKVAGFLKPRAEHHPHFDMDVDHPDAQFITTSRMDVPRLLDEVDQLRGEISELLPCLDAQDMQITNLSREVERLTQERNQAQAEAATLRVCIQREYNLLRNCATKGRDDVDLMLRLEEVLEQGSPLAVAFFERWKKLEKTNCEVLDLPPEKREWCKGCTLPEKAKLLRDKLQAYCGGRKVCSMYEACEGAGCQSFEAYEVEMKNVPAVRKRSE